MLTSSPQMRILNRQFRGKDRATDVLSFPSPSVLSEEFSGDIAISVEIAARNAAHHRHSLMQELRILLLHGVLHLAGYDHERDNGEMARKEDSLRRQLGLSNGLIARASGTLRLTPSSATKTEARERRPASVGVGTKGSGARTRSRSVRRRVASVRQVR